MIVKFKVREEIKIGHKDGYTFISFDDPAILYDLEEAVLFPMFQADFAHYVDVIGDCPSILPTYEQDPELWGKLFEMYIYSRNQDESEWETLGSVYLKAVNDEKLCRMCDDCRCIIFTTRPRLDIHGKAFCDECIVNHTAKCSICGKEFSLKDLKSFNLKEYICENCAEIGLSQGDFVIVDRHSFD